MKLTTRAQRKQMIEEHGLTSAAKYYEHVSRQRFIDEADGLKLRSVPPFPAFDELTPEQRQAWIAEFKAVQAFDPAQADDLVISPGTYRHRLG